MSSGSTKVLVTHSNSLLLYVRCYEAIGLVPASEGSVVVWATCLCSSILCALLTVDICAKLVVHARPMLRLSLIFPICNGLLEAAPISHDV